MEKDGACKMDRQNKKMQLCQKECENEEYAGHDKEEEKKLRPLAKKELPAERCFRRNGKQEESSWQKMMSDDGQHYDKWTV